MDKWLTLKNRKIIKNYRFRGVIFLLQRDDYTMRICSRDITINYTIQNKHEIYETTPLKLMKLFNYFNRVIPRNILFTFTYKKKSWLFHRLWTVKSIWFFNIILFSYLPILFYNWCYNDQNRKGYSFYVFYEYFCVILHTQNTPW